MSVAQLISVIGLLTQTGGAALLAALFVLLVRANPRRPYFRVWARGWLAMVVALVAVLSHYVVVASSPGLARMTSVVYQTGKIGFLACLLGGALNYACGVRPRPYLRAAFPAALAYALATSLPPGLRMNASFALQAPVAAGVCGVCAWALLRLPPSRATLGSRCTGGVFTGMAVLWAAYGATFTATLSGGFRALPGGLRFLAQYNAYLDVLAQMLLGFGMVLLLLEDARREADDARAQLAVAHDHLLRVALFDPLTGALNRRAYDEGFGLDAVGARFGTALMLDMDNLKAVNDACGHDAGDELLRHLVATLRGAIRPLDRVYRWGGDEFLLLFPAARPADVTPRVRDALRRANEALAPEQRRRLELLVSVGAADFHGTEDLPAAIRRADLAMYEEKARHHTVQLSLPVDSPVPQMRSSLG